LAVTVGVLAGVTSFPVTVVAGPLAGWAAPAAIPSAMTHAQGPALAEYNGLLYAVWAGQSSPYHLWYSAFNGISWTAQEEIPSALTNYETGPSVASFGGKLYVVWQGQSAPFYLYYSTFNGSSWSSQTELTMAEPFNSSVSGLAVYNGDLYLSWLNNSFGINYSSFNGSSWSNVETVPSAVGHNFESDDVPLAVYDGDLFVSWENSTSELMYSDFNGSAWTSPQSLGIMSDAGPALATIGTKLYAVFNDYSRLHVVYSTFNGVAWKAAKNVRGATYQVETAPAVADYSGAIYVAWLPTFDPSPIDYASRS
jgi:hypothetical protein